MNSCSLSSLGAVIYDDGLEMMSDRVAAGLLVAVRDTEAVGMTQLARNLVL